MTAALFGHNIWSATVGEERRVGVLENRVLREIFGPKGKELTWKWRTLHNEELHDLYSSPEIIRRPNEGG